MFSSLFSGYFFSWSDRREVFMMNTFIQHGMKMAECRNHFNNRLKPESVLHYNHSMGAIDSLDRTIKPYQSARRTYKWYRKVFFYTVDTAVYNSWIMHKSFRQKKDHLPYKEYLMKIVQEIFSTFPPIPVRRGRPSAPLATVPIEEAFSHDLLRMKGPTGKTTFQDCVWCRKGEKRKMTPYTCAKCKVRLCAFTDTGGQSCFNMYHQQLLRKVSAFIKDLLFIHSFSFISL